ncbi:MAG: MBL fold hydrolase [Planctomycetes bacterium]|jgi:glyoxylase-like metal-dependent hydrolase (beta-lactamase superfamily II)|nr:MBL fold hydrolase [Planctomycetota bacterium]MDP6424715.1 MBL fold metallo-hydrolase [Planctomycetota bacterium]
MERRLWSVLGNSQRLDGGAMFGNAPKALWTRWADVDDENRIALACRAMLVREPERVLLFETGIGAFFEPSLRERFGVQESEHVLLDNLQELGVAQEDIDVVMLSHLHFDHAGGLMTAWREGHEPELCFPNARYVVGHAAWERAQSPHARDRASFVPQLQELLEASGRLEIVVGGESSVLGPDYRFHVSNGHTPGMLLVEVPGVDGPVVFAGDLVPGLPWVRSAITMGYDRYPELLIDEKTALFDDLLARAGRLFFTHDPACAMAGLARDARGRIVAAGQVREVAGLVA